MSNLRALAFVAVYALASAPAVLRAEVPALVEQQASAVILYDGDLIEFPRYATGDQYSIEIPQALRSRLVRGDFSVCGSKDGATVWSFPLPPGTQAMLRHAPGRIEITFTSGPVTPAIAASLPSRASAPSPAPLSISAPSSIRSKKASPPEDDAADAAPSIVLAQSSLGQSDAADPAGSGARAAAPELTAANVADESISLANFALDVPDSPAFAVLGLTPETVVRPSNPQELIASVLNGVDRNGNFQTGLAIDTAPYLLFFGPDVTLAQYRASYITRLLTRAQVSFATSKGAEAEDKAARLALGLHLTLLDRGDPRFDAVLQQSYDEIDEEVRGAAGRYRPGSDAEQQAAEREARMRPRFKEAFETARQRNWNRTNWSVGVAPSWISPSGDGDDLQWNGITVWNSFAYGFEGVPALERSSQLIVHTRYRNREEAPDPEMEGNFMHRDSFLAGARLRIGSVDTNLSFDGAYIREWGDRRDTSAYRVSLGLERRMTDNLWLSLSFGKEFDNDEGKNPLLILGNFKLGYGEKRIPSAGARTAATPVVFRPESRPPPETVEEVAETAPRETSSSPQRKSSDIPDKAPPPVVDRPIRKLQASTPADAGRAGSVPTKAARPEVARKIKKLSPAADREEERPGSVRKAPRPDVKRPIPKLTPDE